jgi:hypothetical protein
MHAPPLPGPAALSTGARVPPGAAPLGPARALLSLPGRLQPPRHATGRLQPPRHALGSLATGRLANR